MRELTPEEIKNAPDWATHYLIACDNTVCYDSADHYMLDDNVKIKSMANGPDSDSKPIIREAFDIWKVKFNGNIALESCDDLSVTFIDGEHEMCLGRTEIIAAAKHLNVTHEELK